MSSSLIYHVSFPKLNIFLEICPIALSFKHICIYWYGIILSIAFLAGCLYVSKNSKKFKLTVNEVSDFVIASSICAIVCARIYYVLFYPGDFYKNHPEKIFMISEGGIAIYGAIIGGILGAFLMCKIKSKSLLCVLDLMAPGVVIGQAIGRWGNFVNQEAFGTPTTLPWGMSSENTSFVTVHPCFLYESLGCLLIFLILNFCNSRLNLKKGTVFFIYTGLYGFLRAFIENLRTDSLMIPYTQIKTSQALAIFLFVFSVLSIICFYRRKKSLANS